MGAQNSMLVVLVFLASVATFVTGRQQPLVYSDPLTSSTSAYDDGLFSPAEDLHILSSSYFTRLTHPLHPGYGVRIKKSHFCDETVK